MSQMAVVPWTYNNPRFNAGRQPVRQFIFQGHVVDILQDTNAEIDATKNTALRLWDGAFLLARHLENDGIFPSGFWKDRRCIELGAGCGLVGLVAWLLGADVTLTDLDLAIPHTQHCLTCNVDRLSQNSAELNKRSSAIRATDFKWGDQSALTKLSAPYSVILGSDIIYSPDSADPLIDALQALSDLSTFILLSYKQRGLGEDIFFTKLTQRGFTFEKVPKRLHPVDFQNSEYDIISIKRCI